MGLPTQYQFDGPLTDGAGRPIVLGDSVVSAPTRRTDPPASAQTSRSVVRDHRPSLPMYVHVSSLVLPCIEEVQWPEPRVIRRRLRRTLSSRATQRMSLRSPRQSGS